MSVIGQNPDGAENLLVILQRQTTTPPPLLSDGIVRPMYAPEQSLALEGLTTSPTISCRRSVVAEPKWNDEPWRSDFLFLNIYLFLLADYLRMESRKIRLER